MFVLKDEAIEEKNVVSIRHQKEGEVTFRINNVVFAYIDNDGTFELSRFDDEDRIKKLGLKYEKLECEVHGNACENPKYVVKAFK